MIRVLYFAVLRDAIGHAEDQVECPEGGTTLGAVREALVARGEPWASAFANLKRIRGAVNQEMADDDEPVKDGDEVAFFPPVTGG
ncbi:MAG: molybdopterin converting factor subunit 1 [Sutterella parvirubra]|mgnify:FL=1|uniref:Molybdopterin synthase sulfur carrier subunit n=1 Tax=Sutterella parvirubra YIT 11816 TaxID=762967 RepID=H3KD37_9BURK|nr:molybdopterin converting factor subunit 1 [Sutterella parvirubra]EHY31975.1 molybdopterin converting factor, subunit 1 [Sutterella parvirubra YIT 11816]MCI7709908.1 molybdopterin converting factor subunit 1 [Sutterella parvirubra]MDR3769990.1 molybdopterin converting factor subunit 1 [Sutterella sp.]MDY5202072.1 molybdopterin converting factor subunit 1 [Sutterella parvirubra]